MANEYNDSYKAFTSHIALGGYSTGHRHAGLHKLEGDKMTYWDANKPVDVAEPEGIKCISISCLEDRCHECMSPAVCECDCHTPACPPCEMESEYDRAA